MSPPADSGGHVPLPAVPDQATAPAAPRQEERQWTVMPNRQ